jgi:hypothetical protein
MPHRHWYAIVTVGGTERRLGPYATRRTAERKASEHFKGVATTDVEVVYEIDPADPHAADIDLPR